MTDSTDDQVDRAAGRVAALSEELVGAIERHVDRYAPDEGEDSVVADLRCAVVVVLGRVAAATSWEKFEVLNEVAEILGLKIKILPLKVQNPGQA